MADERFSGDMSRNEVEIDLNKFMELVTENSNLKAEILKLESEKEPENPWQRWISLRTTNQSGTTATVLFRPIPTIPQTQNKKKTWHQY